MFSLALSPGISQVFYPERPVPRETALDRLVINAFGNATRRWRARPRTVSSHRGPGQRTGRAVKYLERPRD